MRRIYLYYILTIITLLWASQGAVSQERSRDDNSEPTVRNLVDPEGKPPVRPPLPEMSPPPPKYFRKSVRDLLPLYLIEKNGELFPALNWTPEELDALVERLNESQLHAQTPDYICQRLTLTGVQKGDSAELELKMRFTVLKKSLIRIPLQLNGVILLEPPQCSPGAIMTPLNGGGYALLIRNQSAQNIPEPGASVPNLPKEEKAPQEDGKSDEDAENKDASANEEAAKDADSEGSADNKSSTQSTSEEGFESPDLSIEATLKILVPLQKNQSIYSMSLKLPQALFSQLTLEIPYPSIEMPGSDLFSGKTTPIDDGRKTLFTGYSLGTDFRLQWQPSAAKQTDSRILETTAEIHADVRSNEIFYLVNMQLQFSSQSPREFILTLPPNAEALPSPTNEYSIERISSAAENRADNQVKILLNNDYENRAKLTFQARAPLGKGASSQWIELLGFGIPDSVRYSGCIGVSVEKNYQVLWNPDQRVSRVDELPTTYQGRYDYGFMFSEQPNSLLARIIAGRTRINVQPQCRVFVGSEEMRLESTWKYNIRGGQANWLDVDLNGWSLRSVKDIGPENAFTSESQDVDGRVSARLAQPTTGTVEMKMTLYKNIEPGAKDISFLLPCPCANSTSEDVIVAPGIFYVLSATNVKLNPSMDKTEKLIKQNYSTSELNNSTGELFCYRVDNPSAEFKSSLTVLRRQVDVHSNATIHISQTQGHIKQDFEFSVQNESVSQASFIGANSLAEAQDLKFTLDGQELNIRKTTDNGQTRIIASLDPPKIGRFVITASYSVPLSESEADSPLELNLPLTECEIPEDSENRIVKCESVNLELNRVWELNNPQFWELSHAENSPSALNVKNNESDSVASVDDNADSSPLTLERRKAAGEKVLNSSSELTLSIHRKQGMVWDSLTVDRAWIQTWLTPTRRQDALTFQFVPTSPHIVLAAPMEVDMGSLEILLDGKPTDQFRPLQNQRVDIAVPNDGKSHTLEVSYYFNRSSRGFKEERIQLPYLVQPNGADEPRWTRWLYWSLCVPKNVHLLSSPEELNAEYAWQRQGPFFRRNAVYSWNILQQWSGGRHLPDPPQGVNVYLFSGYGQIKEVDLMLMDRTTLVFTSAMTVLIIGLLILHFRRLRKMWVLTVFATVLLGTSLWEPELSLVVLQASAIGVMLLVLSFLFRKKPTIDPADDATIAQSASKGSSKG